MSVSPSPSTPVRLTQYAPGGGCSCKLSPGDLERLLADAYGSLPPPSSERGELIDGLESGDDATVIRLPAGPTLLLTTDFFFPVVDDPFDWGRIAATNAVSDVYAMGGEPVAALNLLAWPRETLSSDVAAEVLRGGRVVADEAGFVLAGGHSIVADVPMYGLSITGTVIPDEMMRNDAACVGDPISLTKPLGLGVLNNWHKSTGSPIEEAVAIMTTSNAGASRLARGAGIRAATDVTGFGLLGHLYKMARASNLTAVVESSAVPVLAGVEELVASGFVPGGSRRNLDWVRPHLRSKRAEDELVLLADAQTSGGLLLAGRIPSATEIGEFVAYRGVHLEVR